MTAFQLPDHIHFCEIGGQRVFLDLAGDRYFSLPPAADAAFASLQDADDDVSTCVGDIPFLLRAGVLIAVPGGKPITRTCHPRPTRSLLEGAETRAGASPRALFEAWLLVLRARHAVKKKKLPAYLQALTRGRPATTNDPAMTPAHALGQFRTARRFIPIAPNCLYDSLALCRFLQRRGICADLVIGAKLYPFGAHCWLQQGEIVLNDSLAYARDFEPVLVA